MINLFKLDIKRALSSRQFFTILIIGIILAISQLFSDVFSYFKYFTNGSSFYNPFTKNLSVNIFNLFSQIFFMIFVLLASIPYADSYWIDKQSGFMNGIYTRVKKEDYLVIRYIVNFIIGGLSVIIPIVLNLYIVFMLIPATHPSILDINSIITKDSMLSNIYYSAPYAYVFIYLCINFLFGGVFASIGLATGVFCKNRFFVLAIPFLIYISMFIFEILGFPNLVPAKFLSAGQPVDGINLISICIIFFILFISSVVFYFIGAHKDEFI